MKTNLNVSAAALLLAGTMVSGQASAVTCAGATNPVVFPETAGYTCDLGDKRFTFVPNSTLPTGIGTFLVDPAAAGLERHTFTFTRTGLSTGGEIRYTIEIIDDPTTPGNELLTNEFALVDLSSAVTNPQIVVNKLFSTTGFDQNNSVLTSTNGVEPDAIAVASGIKKLWVIDRLTAAGANNGWNSMTNTFIQRVPFVFDTTPPVIQSSVTGTLGNGGWYVSDVQVAWTVTDAESAISTSTGCGSTSVTVDTAGVTFTCSATSSGGSSTDSVAIKRDATAPSATASAAPPANQYGWRNQSVTATFSGNDALSGGVTCDAQTIVSTEGAGQSTSGRCYDAAGNQSNLATAGGINIDKTVPTITLGKGNKFSCSDALSGVLTCTGTHKKGELTVTAQDKAGNTVTVTQ